MALCFIPFCIRCCIWENRWFSVAGPLSKLDTPKCTGNGEPKPALWVAAGGCGSMSGICTESGGDSTPACSGGWALPLASISLQEDASSTAVFCKVFGAWKSPIDVFLTFCCKALWNQLTCPKWTCTSDVNQFHLSRWRYWSSLPIKPQHNLKRSWIGNLQERWRVLEEAEETAQDHHL